MHILYRLCVYAACMCNASTSVHVHLAASVSLQIHVSYFGPDPFIFLFIANPPVSGQKYRVNRLYPWDFGEERKKGVGKGQEKGGKVWKGIEER